MKYFIITGTSIGIGESIAEQLISPNHYLYCISRGKNANLVSKSKNIKYYEVDLNQLQQIESLMESVFNSIDFFKAERIYLINNASIIAPVTFIDTAMISDITQNINVNLIAPILLTSLFIKAPCHPIFENDNAFLRMLAFDALIRRVH